MAGSISDVSGTITKNSIDGHITDPLGSTITTGQGSNAGFLLQETKFFLLQEDGNGILLK